MKSLQPRQVRRSVDSPHSLIWWLRRTIHRNSYACAICLTSLAAGGASCQAGGTSDDYVVVQRYLHDTTAYTQGFVYSGGVLYESTGRLGYSQVRRLNLQTGEVLSAVALADDRFGEGLALLNGLLYQLTWKSGVGYVYEAETLARADSFSYTGEGWGLTTDGTSLIMSDGTSTLRYLDPNDFSVTREVQVRDQGSALTSVNELEYVDGELFANIYQSDWIVRLDPTSGEVQQWIDMTGLLPNDERSRYTDVLNGIAYREDTGNLLVTGKLWPATFEIQLVAQPADSGG